MTEADSFERVRGTGAPASPADVSCDVSPVPVPYLVPLQVGLSIATVLAYFVRT